MAKRLLEPMNLCLRNLQKNRISRIEAIKAIIAVIFTVSLLFLIPQTAFAYSVTGNAVKTGEAAIGAGVTPDSFLYFLDKAFDNIGLALTFDSAEKSKKGLNIARERLMEVREMAVANKLRAAQAAQREHARALASVQSSIGKIESTNVTEELEEEIELERELEEHEEEVETVTNELKVKIEVKGEITPEQQALVDSVLNLMQNRTGEVKIKIENKKGETKVKIKAETGKSEIEIEEELEELEEKAGLSELRREKAEEQIEDALEELSELKEKLLEVNVTEFNLTAVSELILQAEQKVAKAQEAFNETKFGEAFGLANAAEHLSENAEKILKRTLEAEDELKEEEGEEKEVEVEIEAGIAKVKVKIAGKKLKYSIPFTTEGELFNDISSRTGLPLEDVKALAEIEVEEVEEAEEEEAEEEETVKVKKGGVANGNEKLQKAVIEDRVKEKEKEKTGEKAEKVKEQEKESNEETGKEEKGEVEEKKPGGSSKSDSGSSGSGNGGKSGSGSSPDGSGSSGSGSSNSGKGSGSDDDD